MSFNRGVNEFNRGVNELNGGVNELNRGVNRSVARQGCNLLRAAVTSAVTSQGCCCGNLQMHPLDLGHCYLLGFLWWLMRLRNGRIERSIRASMNYNNIVEYQFAFEHLSHLGRDVCALSRTISLRSNKSCCATT